MVDRLNFTLPERFGGLLAVGDVHGHAELFARAVEHARERNLFLLSLGDLVDRGPDSRGCLAWMQKLTAAGEGLWIRGNHEDKLYRALIGRPVLRAEFLERTIAELHGSAHADDVRERFLREFALAPFVVTWGRNVFVHGGFDARMLRCETLPQAFRARAIYGQAAPQMKASGKPVRLYGWVDAVPSGVTVFIGHDPISGEDLLTRSNTVGGRVVHVDTNAAKGGPLSGVVFDERGEVQRALQFRPGEPGLFEPGFVPATPKNLPPVLVEEA